MEQAMVLSKSILDIVSRILTFKDDWVTVPDDYEHQLGILKSRLDICQIQVRLHNEPEGSPVIMVLKKAEATLKMAESRICALDNFARTGQCCSHVRLWSAKLFAVLFPENIGKILKKANDELDSIPKILKDEAEVSAQIRDAARRRAIQPSTRDADSQYVPLVRTQTAVVNALESEDHQLVVLHGGVGKGKTTLARFLFRQYEAKRMIIGDQEIRKLFNPPIWVASANCLRKDVSAKQLEILQDYSPNSLGSDSPEEKSGRQRRIAEAFQNFIRDREVLLVFDDVSDPGFLCDMWDVAGPKVKYLVTSQTSNICSSLHSHSVPVHMEDPTEDEATRILASLVGLPDIPETLKVIAGKIIEASEKNPLALACLASHFGYGQDKTNEREWRRLHKGLFHLLRNYKEDKIVLGSTPRSLWATMKICVDNLESQGSRKILYLMYLCGGGSVPEAVLRILYSSSTFARSKNELVARELLKPEEGSKARGPKDNLAEEEGESTYWSLGSLVKHYVKEHVAGEKEKGEMRSMVTDLIGVDGSSDSNPQSEQTHETGVTEVEEARVAIVLCALYFDQSVTDIYEIVTMAMTRTSIAISNDAVDDLRRKAVEPLIWLLDEPESEGIWTELDVGCVRKVLLKYICDCQLDDESMVHLLQLYPSPIAQLDTLRAIFQICIIEDNPLFGKGSLTFVQVIAHLVGLNEGRPLSVQVAASRALDAVCWKASEDRAARLIVESPSVLGVIVSSLAVPDGGSNVIPQHAANDLWNLAYNGGGGDIIKPSIISIILNKEGALEGLVKSLSKQDHPSLQMTAAGALATLACGVESEKVRIGEEPGTIDGLVKLLSAQDNPKGQGQAARALCILAGLKALRLGIANHEGALAGLVKSLTAQNNTELQEVAAAALARLASEDSIAIKIGEEGALDSLVKLLSAQDNPKGQGEAARALCNLARLKALGLGIANDEGALAGLVKSLTAQNNTELQEVAAAALARVASEDSIATKIDEEGALDSLVKQLCAQDNPGGQAAAARALSSLAGLKALNEKIVSQEGALRGLVEGSAQHAYPDLQKGALEALRTIADFDEAKSMLLGREGLLDTLLSLLEGDVDVEIQYAGAWTLTLINPTTGKEARLISGRAYEGRAEAFTGMVLYKEALADLNTAADLLQGAEPHIPYILGTCAIKARLGDLEGALHDANEAVKVSDGGFWKYMCYQERGVSKRMSGDLKGALEDLDQGLALEVDDYEMLKHRGFVKFLLNDEEGARADAERALIIKPSRVDKHSYGKSGWLGTMSIEYLGYDLK